jgi:1-acyl-sn-glycerol-3-phosphate acyltransferase
VNFVDGLRQLAHLALRVFLRIHCGYRVRGKVRLDCASILVANHSSHADIAAIFCALPIGEVSRVRTAAARDHIYAMPPAAVAAVEFLFNTYPFDRKGGSSASLDRGEEFLREGFHLAIFPEGRRSPDGGFLGFTPGFARIAYRTGAPVVPIRILGAHRALPRGKAVMQRLPIEVVIHPPLRADSSVPYESRRDAYSTLMRQAESSLLSGIAPLSGS